MKTLKKRDPLQRDIASDFGIVFRHPEDIGDVREKNANPSK